MKLNLSNFECWIIISITDALFRSFAILYFLKVWHYLWWLVRTIGQCICHFLLKTEIKVSFVITGKKGLYTGSSGLQLAYLSGMESEIVSDSTNFNAIDITSLTSPVVNDSKFKGVDILITSQWPKGVEKYGIALVCIWNFSSSQNVYNEKTFNLSQRQSVYCTFTWL